MFGVLAQRRLRVPRVISFIVLLAIVLLVGAIFFQVMAQFMVPLFLACVLLVVFQPLHRWMLDRLPRWPRLAALFTTVLILLSVLLPLIWLGWRAYVDFHALLDRPAAQAITAATARQADSPQRLSRPIENIADPATNISDSIDASEDLLTIQPEEEIELSVKLKNFVNDLLNRIGFSTWKMNDDTAVKGVSWATTFAGNFVISGVKSAIGIMVGLLIMVISLYYFLADGPGMIRALLRLSPLDERYETELLQRFVQVSRAVVVATLLSAVVQGALAGIGYYFALPPEAPIFLLTALTIVTAMIPFFGAAAVWVIVCLWVYAHGEPTTAIVLAIYCTVIVSGIDNVIKPLVLHGQSNLHPLLALLSILGGVTVLGPVGILVGPMLVSFLQALLNMLRKELESFGGVEPESPLAGMVEAVASMGGDAAALAIPSEEVARQQSSDGRRATQPKSSAPASKPAGSRGWKRKRGR
jgi:predicted PurR-regulated permease PerM